MKIKNLFFFITALLLLTNCKNENIVQIDEVNTFEIINKSFEEKLNEFIDLCEHVNQKRADIKAYNITIGLVFETEDNYVEKTSPKTEVTFMFYAPVSCENIIGMKKLRGYNVFYASLGEDIDKQIIKINKPFNDCLDSADLEIINIIFDPITLFYEFKNGELKGI